MAQVDEEATVSDMLRSLNLVSEDSEFSLTFTVECASARSGKGPNIGELWSRRRYRTGYSLGAVVTDIQMATSHQATPPTKLHKLPAQRCAAT
jgi:hypothetical protein